MSVRNLLLTSAILILTACGHASQKSDPPVTSPATAIKPPLRPRLVIARGIDLPTTMPSTPDDKSLAAGKIMWSIQVLSGADGRFSATCAIGARTIHLQGRLHETTDMRSDPYLRTELDCGIDDSAQHSTQSTKTNIMLKEGETRPISWCSGINSTIVLKIAAVDEHS